MEMHQRLHQLLAARVNSGSRYDVALLLSGGKDSAYILSRLRNEHPELRILAILVNNGFMSPVALENARRTASALSTDLLIINDHIEEFARALRNAFLELNGKPSYGVVDHADGETVFKVGQQAAQKLEIPVVIAGLTWVQLKHIVGIDDFIIDKPGAPKLVFPLAVWRISEDEIRNEVRRRSLIPAGNDSPLVTNHDFILPMSVIDIWNFGYCSFEPEFADLIRQGKADRTHWLHLFELLEYAAQKGFFDKQVRSCLAKLGLTVEDVVRKK
jgi:hypothetical protein